VFRNRQYLIFKQTRQRVRVCVRCAGAPVDDAAAIIPSVLGVDQR
jgi:hypothetical protein